MQKQRGGSMKQRRIGIGTISLVLVFLAIIWGLQWNDGSNISGVGVFVLKSIGLGNLVLWNLNMPYLFTYFFTIPAFVIGRKHNQHWGARTGQILSAVYAAFVCLLYLGILF